MRSTAADHQPSRATSFWLWTGLAGASLVATGAFGFLIWKGGVAESKAAKEEGRIVLVDLATRQVTGGLAKPKSPELPPVAPTETPKVDAPKTGTSPPMTPEAAPESAAPAPVTSTDGVMLRPAPGPGISEPGADGPLPMVGQDGATPMQYYARPFTNATKLPMVAVILTEVGLNKPLSDEAFQLPGEVSLSYSPYARELESTVRQGRARGHEAYVDLVLEPSDYPSSDPGPKALLTDLSETDQAARLGWMMSRFSGYVGLVSTRDEVYTASPQAMKPVIDAVKKRGVVFVYGEERERDNALNLGKAAAIPMLAADSLLDRPLAAPVLLEKFAAAEQAAKTHGRVLVVARAHPLTHRLLKEWLAGLPGKGFAIAPASALLGGGK